MRTTEQLFSDPHEIAAFADVILEIDRNVDINTGALQKIFEDLPERIRDIAHCWGLSDTVFRDEAYVFLRTPKG